ncbi:hypothetical protein AMAG_19424 [Allomyces macrogynus ATCC 38327]|uniref:Uncharacterized protein n=1 Tax=Allomyces macrogynus (strain ATCC 38327) TaxID=578462 RepID=A0A0L0SRG0_ALLM3|nr:hypothetical protein AMAG_19424 [Allomyces macrogynus ATCC 38327]|eukprot:KNE65086.1 hypothetical protein AMAG_19424 [Allomyces macrogynus ATCC 38327]
MASTPRKKAAPAATRRTATLSSAAAVTAVPSSHEPALEARSSSAPSRGRRQAAAAAAATAAIVAKPTRKRTRAAASADDGDHPNEPQVEAVPAEKRPIKRARTASDAATASSSGYMTRARSRASVLDQVPSSSVAAPAPARSTGEIHALAKHATRKVTTAASAAPKSRKTTTATTTTTTADGVKWGRSRPRKAPLPQESADAMVVDSVPVAAEQASSEQTGQPMDEVPDPPEVPPESPPTLSLLPPTVDTPATAMWTPRRRRWSSGGVKLLDSVPEPVAESAAANTARSIRSISETARSILSITDINATAPPAPHTTTGLTPFVDASSWSVAKPRQVASPLTATSTPTAQSVKREPRRPSTVAVHRFTGAHADPPTVSRAALALFTPNRRPALARSVSFSASKQVLLTHSPCEYDRKSIESTRSKRSKGVISTDGYRSLMRSLDEYKLTEMQVHPASKGNTRIMMSGRRGAGTPRGAPVVSPVNPEAEAMRANSFLQAIMASPEGSSAIAAVTAPSPLEDDNTAVTHEAEFKAPQAPAPVPASASPIVAEDEGEEDDDAETVYHPSAATTPSHSARPMRVHAVAGSNAAPPVATPTTLLSHVFSAVGSIWSRLSTPGAARGRASARLVVEFQSDLENNPFA